MEIGATIKQIRISKKMKKKDVYDGIVSATFSYYFENGKHSIKVDNLYKILSRLNIGFNEFYLIHSNYNYRAYNNLILDISTALNTKLDDLHEIFEINYHSNDINKKLLAALSYSLYLINNQMPLDDDISLFIRGHLLAIKEWTLYDIELFQYALVIFYKEPSYLVDLLEKVLNKLEIYYQSDFEIEKIEIILQEIYINYTQIFILNNQITDGQVWQKAFKKRFNLINSIGVQLNIKCGTLLLNFFIQDKRAESIKEYDIIITFLEKTLNSNFNLKEIGDVFRNFHYKSNNLLPHN